MDIHYWDTMSQGGVLLSALGAWMVGRKNKWGWVVWVLSEPFWFYTSIVNRQGGVFISSVIFSITLVISMIKWFKDESVENSVAYLAEKYKTSSRLEPMMSDPQYEQVVKKGVKAIPHLLKLLLCYPHESIYLLSSITNAQPVPQEHAGNIPVMIYKWHEWGRQNGYQR